MNTDSATPPPWFSVVWNDSPGVVEKQLRLRQSFQHTVTHKGPHGLPLIGRADWNDCLNLNCFSTTPGESFQTTENQGGGVAESVFIGTQFVLYGADYAAIAERHGLPDVAA